MPTLPLPLTVTIAANGAASVDYPGRIVAMSRFSETAARLASTFGPGEHTLATAADVAALPEGTVADLAQHL